MKTLILQMKTGSNQGREWILQSMDMWNDGTFIQQIFTEHLPVYQLLCWAQRTKRWDADSSLRKLTVNDSENHNAMC